MKNESSILKVPLSTIVEGFILINKNFGWGFLIFLPVLDVADSKQLYAVKPRV